MTQPQPIQRPLYPQPAPLVPTGPDQSKEAILKILEPILDLNYYLTVDGDLAVSPIERDKDIAKVLTDLADYIQPAQEFSLGRDYLDGITNGKQLARYAILAAADEFDPFTLPMPSLLPNPSTPN